MIRVHKGWTTFEYCWRFGVRPLMWAVRLAVVVMAAAVITLLLPHVSTLGMFTVALLYGIYEIGRSIRAIQPLNISIAKGEVLTVESGATISVPKADLDRVIDAIARQEARR